MKPNRKQFAALIALLFIMGSLLPACQLSPQATDPATTPGTEEKTVSVQTEDDPTPDSATANPTRVAEPLPPQLIQITPAPGEEQALDAPLQLVFDQPMDAKSVQKAFGIEPQVDGEFEWPMPNILHFAPDPGFDRATRYTVTLDQNALSEEGLELREPASFKFETIGYLEISAVQPADQTSEVGTDAIISVLFNRPVVPLTAIENQDSLPQPLTLIPPATGTGAWLNTSIYMFTPDQELEPATIYKARINSSLTDMTGGVLAEDYTWEFTTVMPAAIATIPDDEDLYVSTLPTIQVAFNQPMDQTSVESVFSLEYEATGDVVEGSFEWSSEGMALPAGKNRRFYSYTWDEGDGPTKVGAETMSFTPNKPLEFDSSYCASIPKETQGKKGNTGTNEEYTWCFLTIAYPKVVDSYPADGEDRADPWGGLDVEFSSPMDTDSLDIVIREKGPKGWTTIDQTEVYSYWWDSDTELSLSFDVKASTDYDAVIGRSIQGRYGQKLGKDTTIEWSSRAYDPQVYLYAPYKVGTYSAYTPTVTYVNVRNVSQVDFSLYQMPFEDFMQTYGEDSWDFWDEYAPSKKDLIRSWSLDVAPELNQNLIYGTNLAGKKGATLKSGIYYLEVETPPEGVYPEAEGYGWLPLQRLILVVSKHNLSLKTTATESLVWATDLKTGEVLSDLPIQVVDEEARILSEGDTDRDGIQFGEDYEPMDSWDPVVAYVGDPDKPDDDFAIAVSRWNDGISPWEFDVPVEDYQEPINTYFLTDRTIYRPGQTVYFKLILRDDDDAHYSIPGTDNTVNIAIYDPQGTRVFEEDMDFNDMGTVHSQFELGEEAALGYYSIDAEYQDSYFGGGFQVAEYRKPEFQVSVETDRLEYVQGDKINVTAQANYFFGGAVSEADVRYNILSADYFFNYEGKGWWDFTDYDYDRYDRYYGSYGEVIAEGKGTTDSDGRFTFSVDADIAEYIASQRLTIEATVTDINDQEVSSRTEAVVHKGEYYIGLQPEHYVGRTGQENSINIITMDWESQSSPRHDLEVVFSEHNWYSVRKQAEDGNYYWESTVEDVPILTQTIKTDSEGMASVSFSPEKGGVYKVSATGLDDKENEIRSSTYMWVSGRKYINWRQENNDRIDLVTDQRQYKVGDTATILVPHPFEGEVQALITVERGHIYQHWVETLETNSDLIEIEITEDLIPNVFVSVMIVKGQDDPDSLPAFKLGYAQLPIDTTEKELAITLTPDKPVDEHYQPGDNVSYDVSATNSQGEPVDAEIALSLVDLSVLSLTDEAADVVNTFWNERGLGVSTATGLTLSVDRINLAIAPEAKGGGGGMGDDFGVVRRRFPDTAYWNPTVRTGESGHTSITVELPDNLTTWRMNAWGVTADTLVGQARNDIISTKNLLVRPVAPRFFVVGDEAELGTVVNNNTSQSMDVEIAFQAEGLEISGPDRQQLTIPPNDQVRVSWPVKVNDVSEAVLRFGAKSEEYSDAIEIPLPVYKASTPEVVATAGQLDEDDRRIEGVVLPPSYDPTQGELTVQLDPSLAAGMTDGLDYLEHFPYECTEQTVSRFLPNVVTYRAFKDLGLDRPDLETTLPGLVGVGLQRLYNQQHYDGGWGWWVIDPSDSFLTAYVLLGMVEADHAGFIVDEQVMSEAADFLHGSMDQPKDLELSWQANRQAFILYVLAEAGEGDLGRTVALFSKRDVLDNFGKAYLAMALNLLEPKETSRVDALLSDISSAAIVSATGAHWEEAQVDYFAMNTDTRSTAIILDALARLDPENGLAPNAVRWLMSVRDEGHWETTQENAWAVMAFTDWMVATAELEGHYDWQVLVNEEELGQGNVDSSNIKESTKLQIEVAKLLADEVNRVVIERQPPAGESSGTGRLYYALYLRYFKPVEEVTALNRGIIVSRQYTLDGCDEETENCRAIDEAQVGDVIKVKLTIIAPNDLHYAVVEDPFPAGAEGVDQSLKTTSVVGERPTLTRTDRRNPWGGDYGWWWFSHTEMRDEKAVLFATYLPRGTYEYTYLIRASLPGEYRLIPTNAYQMYFPEVFGRGDGGLFTITE